MRRRLCSLLVLTLALTACGGAEDAWDSREGESVAAQSAAMVPGNVAGAPRLVRPVTSSGATTPANSNTASGSVIVQLAAPVAKSLRAASAGRAAVALQQALPASLRALGSKHGAQRARPLFSDARLSALQQANRRFPQRAARAAAPGSTAGLENFVEISIDPSLDPEQVAREYANDPNVVSAEPNRIASVFALTPNDEFFAAGYNWGLTQIQGAGLVPPGASTVTVAVIDSGVDTTHPDLAPQIAQNTDEIAGNGVDDDGNGYADDTIGWDFVDEDALPNDGHGHGTHVAGTIAAASFNQYGVASAALNAKIMPLRALNTNGQGLTTDLVDAIYYAVANGADVINNSWGGPGRSALVDNAIQGAVLQGVVVISAAGNDNKDAAGYYPANSEYGITVAATTNTDTKASYSNFGAVIDVAAPGGRGGSTSQLGPTTDILSASPQTSTLLTSGVPFLVGGDGAKYVSIAGTSMASPHAASVAALLLEKFPTWGGEHVRTVLRQTADDVEATGLDPLTGYGRVNATRARQTPTGTIPRGAALYTPYNGQEVSGTVNLTGWASAGSGQATYRLEAGAGASPASFTTLATGSTYSWISRQINTHDLVEGANTLRLSHDLTPPEDRNVVTVNNVFFAPSTRNAVISGSTFSIQGQTAGNLGFQSYQVEYAPGRNATTGFTSIVSSTTQLASLGELASWNAAALPDGMYTLRLRATFASYTDTETTNVLIDRRRLPGFPQALDHVPTLKSAKIADIDRDGVAEVVYGAAVFNADGSLESGWSNVPGLGRTNSAIVDIDGDPALEIVAVDYNPGQAWLGSPVVRAYDPNKTVIWSRILRNPEMGAFPDTQYQEGTVSSVAAGDVDADGTLEIVVADSFAWSFTGAKIGVFVLDAASGAIESQFTLPGSTFGSVALADIDGDTALDIVVANKARDLHVLRPNGAALSGWPQAVPSTAVLNSHHVDPVIADIDGDLSYEILFAGALFRSNGTAVAGWPVGERLGTGVLGQLDAAGSREVVHGSYFRTVHRARRSDGSLLFSRFIGEESVTYWNPTFSDATAPATPVLYDVNADGQVDLISTSDNVFSDYSSPLPIYASNGNNGAAVTGFNRFVRADLGGAAGIIHSTPTFGDLNGDGTVEMVLAAGSALHAWNLAVPPSQSPWSMFQRDYENTGTIPAGTGLLALKSPTANLGLVLGAVNASGYGDVLHAPLQGSAQELFRLDHVGTRLFRVRQYVQERCLYVDPASPSSVRHRACSAADSSQVFELVSFGNGVFRFKNQGTNRCLTRSGGDADGTVTALSCDNPNTSQLVTVQRIQGENLALRASVTAQSTYPYEGYSVQRIKDGSRSTALGGASSWSNAAGAAGLLPQWVDLNFGAPQAFDRVDLYTTASYPIQDYELQFWDGATWRRILRVTGNVLSSRSHVFPRVTSDKLRVLCQRGPTIQPIHARINELEVYRAE